MAQERVPRAQLTSFIHQNKGISANFGLELGACGLVAIVLYFPNTASLHGFATVILITLRAGIVICSPVAGFLPTLAFLWTTFIIAIPGIVNFLFFLAST